MVSPASPQFRKGVKQIVEGYKSTNRSYAVFVWLTIIACSVLAYFDLWRVAWLVIALMALKTFTDVGLGLVAGVTNIFVMQARRYDSATAAYEWGMQKAPKR